MTMQQIFDGYAHIGLPRFQSAEGAVAAMDASGIKAALVCPFETCPDLVEVHRAYTLQPSRFRIFGLALGRDRTEIEAGLHAQFDAGFEGMRLNLERIAEAPYVLDVIAERKGIPLVVSNQGDRKSTRLNSSHANISYAVFCLKKKTTAERGTTSNN